MHQKDKGGLGVRDTAARLAQRVPVGCALAAVRARGGALRVSQRKATAYAGDDLPHYHGNKGDKLTRH